MIDDEDVKKVVKNRKNLKTYGNKFFTEIVQQIQEVLIQLMIKNILEGKNLLNSIYKTKNGLMK